MHIHTKYEVLWLGGLCADTNTDNVDDSYAQRTNHDYVGLFGIIPNEPKSLICLKYPVIYFCFRPIFTCIYLLPCTGLSTLFNNKKKDELSNTTYKGKLLSWVF